MARVKSKRRTTKETSTRLHTDNHENPHQVTAEQLGLGNVLDVSSYSKNEVDQLITSLQVLINSLEAQAAQLENDKLDRQFSIHTPADGDPIPSVVEGELNQYTEVRMEGGVKVTEHKIRNQYGDDFMVLSFKEII